MSDIMGFCIRRNLLPFFIFALLFLQPVNSFAIDTALVLRNLKKQTPAGHIWWTQGTNNSNPGQISTDYHHLVFKHKCDGRTERNGRYTPIFYVKDSVNEVDAAEWMVKCLYRPGDTRWNFLFTSWRITYEINTEPWEGIENLQALKIAMFNESVAATRFGFYVVLGYYQLFLPGWSDLLITAFQLHENLTNEQVDRASAVFDGATLALGVARFLPLSRNMSFVYHSPTGVDSGVRFSGDDLINMELRWAEFNNILNAPLQFRKFASVTTANADYIRSISKAYGLTNIRFLPASEMTDRLAGFNRLTREILLNRDIVGGRASYEAVAIAHELVHAVHFTDRLLGRGVSEPPVYKLYTTGLSEVFAWKRTIEFVELSRLDPDLFGALDPKLVQDFSWFEKKRQEYGAVLLDSMACLSKMKTVDGKPDPLLRRAAQSFWKMVDFYGASVFTKSMKEAMSPSDYEKLRVIATEWQQLR